MQAAGLDPALGRRGLIFDDPNTLIQATLASQGIALLTRQTVERELADSRLVAPFALTLSGDYGYYLCYLPEAIKRPKLKAFRDFVLQEMGARGAPGTAPHPVPLPARRGEGTAAPKAGQGSPRPRRGRGTG